MQNWLTFKKLFIEQPTPKRIYKLLTIRKAINFLVKATFVEKDFTNESLITKRVLLS